MLAFLARLFKLELACQVGELPVGGVIPRGRGKQDWGGTMQLLPALSPCCLSCDGHWGLWDSVEVPLAAGAPHRFSPFSSISG